MIADWLVPHFTFLIKNSWHPRSRLPNREQGADCEDYFHLIAPVMADSAWRECPEAFLASPPN
jgi:hypothetical protein